MADVRFEVKKVETKRIIMNIYGTAPEGEITLRGDGDAEVLYCLRYDNKFTLAINLLAANGNYPLDTGEYRLYIGNTPAAISCEGAGVHIDKDKMNYFYADVLEDEGEFLLKVDHSSYPSHRRLTEKRFGESIITALLRNAAEFKHRLYRAAFHHYNKNHVYDGKNLLFASGSRDTLSGNEKYIYDELVRRGLDKEYNIMFDFKRHVSVKRGIFTELRFIKKLAHADIIMIDDYYPEIYTVDYPDAVKVVQVWHACGAFKAVGLERVAHPGEISLRSNTHKCYTHVPVTSVHSALHHSEAFGLSLDKFYPIGVARTDIFFDDDYRREMTDKMHALFPETASAKMVYLYAPTFRGTGALTAYFPYDKFDLVKMGEFLRSTDAVMILKKHPLVKDDFIIPEMYADRFINASDYGDVNDLLFITDLLITDYSSVMYEFSLLNRPTVFYAFDREEYERERDFYESYTDTVYGEVVYDFDALLATLEKGVDTAELARFIDKNFTYTDGLSARRFVDQIILGKDPVNAREMLEKMV